MFHFLKLRPLAFTKSFPVDVIIRTTQRNYLKTRL